MRKFIVATSMAAALAPMVVATPAEARPHRHHHRHYNGHQYYGGRYYRGDVWRGRDGRYYCRRSNGTTGLIVGGVAGALLGRAIDTHGERATGTILGAAGGALLGRAIERDNARCR